MPLVRAEEPGGDFQEIEVDGEKFTQSSPPRKLREALKICGLPKGRLKADAWERLKFTKESQELLRVCSCGIGQNGVRQKETT